DFNYVKQSVWKIIKKITVEDILVNKQLIIQLIIIVLLGSVFVKLSGSFNGNFVSEQGFYVTYLMITSILLSSFLISLDMVGDAIDSIISFVKIVIPVYALSMNFVGNPVSSAGMYELIMVGIWLVQIVISGIVLPMIKFYVIVSLVNNLNKEDSLSKLCILVRNIVIWMLKTIVVFIVGLSIIKSLLEPQLDALGKNTINKIVSAIPGGGMGALITGTFLKAGVVIKNSIGIAGIIILGIIALAPVLKTFIIMMLIRVTAAMLQPIGEKRYVNGIETLASGMSLLLKAIGSSVALFMLVVAIMAYASSG
ncbi:MAG: stage III sporulation protein AE, partial [Lachnospiraceae bacterium]|nr:stage III sporulation protein AE [Lachnospiraceae bacterium]